MILASIVLVSVGSAAGVVVAHLIARLIVQCVTKSNPVNDFKIEKSGYFKTRGKKCHICLESFTLIKPGYCISFCNNDLHPGHWGCILRCLHRKMECPVCRSHPPLPILPPNPEMTV
jgi:hypothetical protein